MEKYLEYSLQNQKLADLYEHGNDRIKSYLLLIFERSYHLFVLHAKTRTRSQFWEELKRAKTALTQDDLHFLAKYGAEHYSEESFVQEILHGVGDGDSEFDTTDVLLKEWRIPKNIHYFCRGDVPPDLQKWLSDAIEDFRGESPFEGNWYLKYVRITFLFDTVWYCVFPSDLQINKFTFERYADEIMLSLQSYGARYTRYEGMID